MGLYDHCLVEPFCALCLASRTVATAGPAINAGEEWAREVRARTPHPLPWWPRWDAAGDAGHAAARRRAAPNESSTQVRDHLARLCWEAARLAYFAPLPPVGVFTRGPDERARMRAWLRERDARG